MQEMQDLTVAAIQAPAIPGDVKANAETGARLVTEAARRGARLAVLPELFLPAYHMQALEDLATDVAADPAGLVEDARLDPLRAAASDDGILVLVGAAVRRADGRRTIGTLLMKEGRVRHVYDKLFLCGPHEKALFQPGDRGATLHVGEWRFGLGICYDGCFPEHARDAQTDDVHGMLYSSAYPLGSEHRRDIYYAARALDNTSYVVFANAVDGEAPWQCNGGAAIYEPEGRALAKAPNSGESVQVVTLTSVALAYTRDRHAMLAERPAPIWTGAEMDRDQVWT
jgi:5-aminopentanamidase